MRVSLAANCKQNRNGVVSNDVSKYADILNPAITAAVAAAAGANTASLAAGDATFTALPNALDVVYMSAFKKATCPLAREDATADTFVTTGGKVRRRGLREVRATLAKKIDRRRFAVRPYSYTVCN